MELVGLVPVSVGVSRRLTVVGELLPKPGELPPESVTEAPLVGETVVVLATSPEFSSAVPPTDAPSLGDCWSVTSPSVVLYHWHWKSVFHISAGSRSAGLVSVSGSSVALAVSVCERKNNVALAHCHYLLHLQRCS